MKKRIFYLASVALAAGLAACSNEDLEYTSGYDLKSNELAATIQEAENTSTRVNIDDEAALRWDNGDQIGVFGDDNKGNYLYTLAKSDGAKGVFKTAVTTSFTPALAYYPYDSEGAKSIDDAESYIYFTLKGTESNPAIYSADKKVEIPMVGTISNQDIKFKNVSALVKLTVVNMPAKYTRAQLTAINGNKLAGSGYVDVADLANNEKPVLKLDQTDISNSSTTIIQKDAQASAFQTEQGGTYDFYFIVPEGNYSSGLAFELYKPAEAPNAAVTKRVYTRKGSIKANTLYEKTLRFEGDELQDDTYGEYNDQLAAGNDLTATLTKSGTLFIPASDKDSITVNLNIQEISNTEATTVTIKEASENASTPKVHINLVSGTSASSKLVIDLPNSAVTLEPRAADTKAATRADDPTVTLATLTATTAKDVLFISKGITVTAAITMGGGYVYQQSGATLNDTPVSKATSNNYGEGKVYLFKEGGSSDDAQDNYAVATIATYKLMFPKTGTIKVEEGTSTLTNPATIGKGQTVTLDLNGQTMTADATSEVIIVDGGTLNITDSSTGTAGKIQENSTTGVDVTPAIKVINGGTVTLEKVAISNAAGVAVTVDGSGSTFTLKSGSISSKSDADVISVDNGGKATINDATLAITGDIDVKNGSADIKALSFGALKVNGANAEVKVVAGTTGAVTVTNAKTVNIEAATSLGATTVTAGDVTLKATTAATTVTVNGGSVDLTAATVGALVVANDGSLTLKDGAATAGVTVTGGTNKQATFKVEKGTISQSTSNAAIAASADAKVVISGGTITGNGTDAALQLTGKSEATISGTAELVSGTGNVVDIKTASDDANKVTLNIEGSPVLRAAATGSVNAIATDASSAKAVINISGGTFGKYTTTSGGKETSTELATAVDLESGTLNISGGTFEGQTSAITVVDGTLNVTGAASFKSAGNVISAVSTTKSANINLAGEGATYEATSAVDDLTNPAKGFAVFNYSSSTALIGTIAISKGKFIGDIASDKGTHFIDGGTFQNCDYLNLNDRPYLYVALGKSLVYNSTQKYFEVK
jgi:hypothetical protein